MILLNVMYWESHQYVTIATGQTFKRPQPIPTYEGEDHSKKPHRISRVVISFDQVSIKDSKLKMDIHPVQVTDQCFFCGVEANLIWQSHGQKDIFLVCLKCRNPTHAPQQQRCDYEEYDQPKRN